MSAIWRARLAAAHDEVFYLSSREGALEAELAAAPLGVADPYARRHYGQLQHQLTWVGLDHKADTLADSLSYGDQRKLEFARALATEPKLLLLDEPVAGMNPSEKTILMEEIRNIRARGYGVFMIEHDMRFVMGLCDSIAVLNFGRIIAQGNPDAIRKNPEVIDAYLGTEDAA